MRGLTLAAGIVLMLGWACGSDSGVSSPTAFTGFDGCKAGAGSVVAFLQRTLDQVSGAEPAELAELLPKFDEGVHALLLRAQEVHCTEDGFTAAIVSRVDELAADGAGAEYLVNLVRERGLGSLDESKGGPIALPAAA